MLRISRPAPGDRPPTCLTSSARGAFQTAEKQGLQRWGVPRRLADLPRHPHHHAQGEAHAHALARREELRTVVSTHAADAVRAERARATTEAVRQWQIVFNGEFPSR